MMIIIHPACSLVTLLSMLFQPISHVASLKLSVVVGIPLNVFEGIWIPPLLSELCHGSTVSPLHVIFSLERQWVKTLYIKSHKIVNKYMQEYQFHFMKIWIKMGNI